MLDEAWLRPDWPAPRAFMTTQAGEASLPRLAELLGARPVPLHQVHGAMVVRLGAGMAPAPQADASVSTDPALACMVRVADCLPVLLAAPGGVAAAHAGWRGLAAAVLENTVAALSEAAACQPGQIKAWLGACIGPRTFEVGEDVLRAFGGPSDFFAYRPNAAGEPRWLADLPGLARQRLQACGLRDISGGSWCTYSEPSRFFSFRRGASGRMVAAIALGQGLPVAQPLAPHPAAHDVEHDGQGQHAIQQQGDQGAEHAALAADGLGGGHQHDDEDPGDGDDVHLRNGS